MNVIETRRCPDAHRNDLVQRRRRVDDRLAGGTLDRNGQVADLDRQLTAFVGRRVGDEDRAREVGAQPRIAELDQRRVGVAPVFHSGLVAAQERRRDVLGHREIHELARAPERTADDLHRLDVSRVAQVGLEVVLRRVGGIRRAPVDEPNLARERREPRDLGRHEKVSDLEQHAALRRPFASAANPTPGSGPFPASAILAPATGAEAQALLQLFDPLSMVLPPADAHALAQSGADALRRGDARTARASFERIVGAGAADAASYIGLAYACRDLSDAAGVDAALDKALELEPQNLGALILKADHLTALGDARSARLVLSARAPRRSAGRRDAAPTLRDELARAKVMCERYAGDFESFLLDRLAGPGLPNRPRSHAVSAFARLAAWQEATSTSSSPVSTASPNCRRSSSTTANGFRGSIGSRRRRADIRAELMSVLAETAPSFVPYVRRVPGRPHREPRRTGGESELERVLHVEGRHDRSRQRRALPEDAGRARRRPAGLRAQPLARRSSSRSCAPAPTFPPHTGLINTRLICHLPLIVPPECGLARRQRHAHADRGEGLGVRRHDASTRPGTGATARA